MKTLVIAERIRRGLRNEWQQHVDASALAGFAPEMDQTSIRAHNVLNCGQTEARTFSPFGGEECFEHVGARGIIHTIAVIFDREEGARY